jgi:hypothetical protein
MDAWPFRGEPGSDHAVSSAMLSDMASDHLVIAVFVACLTAWLMLQPGGHSVFL